MCEYACSKYIPKSHILRNQMLWFRILVIVKISKSHKHIYSNKNRRMQSTVKKTKTLLVRRIHWRVLEVIKYISFNKKNYEQYLSRNYGQSNISELGHAGKLVGHSPTVRKSQVQLGQAKEDETVSRTPPWPLHPLLSHVLAVNSLSDFFQQ